MDQNDAAAGRSMSLGPVSLARVLVALDGSRPATQALPFTAAIAGGSAGAEVILLEVTPPASNVRNILGREIAPAERVQEGYRQVASDRLEAAGASLPAGLGRKTLVAVGDPAEEILRAAEAERADLIALTASGAGAWGPSAFGRVVDRVVRAANRPVLVVPPSPPPPSGPVVTGILVPIDGSGASLAALPVAAALAGAVGVPVRVVQALASGAGATPLPPGLGDADALDRELRGATHAAATAAVADAVARLEVLGVTAGGDVLAGDPVAAVISEARRTDLVVLTSRGEGQTAGDSGAVSTSAWSLGGVADKLLRAGTAPMVLVPGPAQGTT